MLGVPPYPFYQPPPQLAWPAHQWTEPPCPSQSSCYKFSRRQEGRHGGEAALLESCGLQAVAISLCSLIKRADSLGPLRLDLAVLNLRFRHGGWSACWSTLEREETKGSTMERW